ncbi:hypothetical protein HDF14_003353 [Edaphobacter lichenicola]|uniref:Uncharacterized protein n=1 Tax=Tunturiibacter gelidiferens TaxID=3069689 RepID=A0A9X0QFZ4_9BACT|nr:hypothetical protein [Edaphobacter lichenicola]
MSTICLVDFCKLLTIRSNIQESGQEKHNWSYHSTNDAVIQSSSIPRQANERITIYAYRDDSREHRRMQPNINQKVDHRLH